jgi:hypothetical protein
MMVCLTPSLAFGVVGRDIDQAPERGLVFAAWRPSKLPRFCTGSMASAASALNGYQWKTRSSERRDRTIQCSDIILMFSGAVKKVAACVRHTNI